MRKWCLFCFFLFGINAQPQWNQTLYGNVPPTDYLLGKFDPESNSMFSPVASFGLTWQNSYVGYLRDDVGSALYTMISAFNLAYPTVKKKNFRKYSSTEIFIFFLFLFYYCEFR